MSRYNHIPKDCLDLNGPVLDNLYTAAKSIKKTAGEKDLHSILFSSVNDSRGVAEAAVHIAYLMTILNQKVLLINIDSTAEPHYLSYLEVEGGMRLMETLKSSPYLSGAIEQTQYESLNYIGIEDIEDESRFAEILNDNNIKARLIPMKNYYDQIIIAGPEYERFSKYANIFELADGAVTISRNRTSDYRKLNKYLNHLKLFDVHSIGIIRRR